MEIRNLERFPNMIKKSHIFNITNVIAMLLLAFAARAQSLYDYPRSADYLVIEYTQIITMLENQDPTPLLRIYGDGRVLVHKPTHRSNAGDYEMQLSDAELQNILSSLEANGLFIYDHKNIAQLKQKSLQQALAGKQVVTSPVATMISDDTYTVIKINLGSYMPGLSGKAITNFKKEVSLKNIYWDAKDYPNLIELKNAASAKEQLGAFLNNPNLNKLK